MLLLCPRRERGAAAGGSGRFSDVVIREVPLAPALSRSLSSSSFFSPPLFSRFKLIDASLQVAGLGAGPVGVAGTLLSAHPRLLAPRLGSSVLLPKGDRRLTSARPGVGGIHLKVIVFPLALQPSSWVGVVLQVWASQLRLAGWFVTSALHSLWCTHTRPRKARARNPRGSDSARGVVSRRRSPTPPGDLPEDTKSQTFL